MIDISALPAPQIIEELDHEAIVSRQNTIFQQRWAEVRAANPDASLPVYDVVLLETDPPVILNEAESYRETLMRQRVNEAIQAYMLPRAVGSDLDMLAAFYDVTRLAGEKDDRLRARVVLEIQGRSTGGTAPRYKARVMAADVRIADAIIYTVGRSPLIHAAIFSTDADGVASPELLAIADAALQAPDVRMVNDTIVTETAVRTVVNISADAWLLPDADAATLERAQTALRTAWATENTLGRNLVLEWWKSKLMIAGMYKITPLSPLGDVVASPAEAISLGTITLNFRGRDF
ncbi:baseplate J/gp47 family protein [Rhizobium sp. SU303]|uniref:baseplate J/gp47 family protein n=1 Tax=Rhizobium sp. SU303 TaxID=3138065 RepID=UPI001E4005A3|nr:baseplate J/gp47 family protein [Rhizobium leguminosarum]UFW80023.1 baseplate J/gp47 family protein [Rhizobium leguminosarum bv. viciae]